MDFGTLTVRKLADTSEGERIIRYDPETGAKKLVNPATPGNDHEPWPLLGVEPVDELPKVCRVSTGYVQKARQEGWAELEGEDVVHRPTGPPDDLWRNGAHTFVQATAVTFHFQSGSVKYKVTHQPDKYVDSDNDKDKVTDEIYAAGKTRVDHFYDLERVHG